MSAIKNISLYIPHVFPNFDKEYIANAFKNIGEVSQIDLVAKQDRNGNNYNAVYVHFKKWYTNKKALAFYESVVDESKEARLCHDEPWYWIVLPNTAKKHIPGERKPRIDLGDKKAISSENKYDGHSVLTAEKTFEDELDILEGDIQNSWNGFKEFKKNASCDRKPRIDLGESKSISAPRPAKSLLPLLAFIPEKSCPPAPKKPTYADAISKPLEEVKKSLETTFDIVVANPPYQMDTFDAEIEAEMNKLEAEMDEIEDFLEAEDENLVRIDGRYVQQLEQENWAMSAEIAELRAALIKMDQMYQAEAAKVRAFTTTSVDL